jgi:hypothetical protein
VTSYEQGIEATLVWYRSKHGEHVRTLTEARG